MPTEKSSSPSWSSGESSTFTVRTAGAGVVRPTPWPMSVTIGSLAEPYASADFPSGW